MNTAELKTKLKEKISGKSFVFLYDFWRALKFFAFDFCRILAIPLLFPLNIFLKKQNEYLLVFKFGGVGDLIVLTSVAEHYSKKGKVILISSKKEIFENLNVSVLNPNQNKLLKFFIPILNSSIYSNIIGVFENPLNMNKKKIHLREALLHKRKDIIKELSDAKVSYNSVIRFSEQEIEEFSKKYISLKFKKYALIVSGEAIGGLSSVKNWGKENMQEVINKTYKKIKWIQIGMKNEPKLKKTFLDLRGKTPLREIFFLASRAKLIVTTEGFLTHLSSAFNIPCITTYSGYHYPEISSYKNVIPIQPTPLPECAYCWHAPCYKYSYPLCLKNIKVKDVVKEVEKILE